MSSRAIRGYCDWAQPPRQQIQTSQITRRSKISLTLLTHIATTENVVHADEILTAFVELESAIRAIIR